MHNNIFMRMSCILFLGLPTFLSGCALPNGGPRSVAFEEAAFGQVGTRLRDDHESGHERVDYVLVDIDSNIMKTLTKHDRYAFAGQFSGRARPPADIRIGVGDKVRVTIFEAGSGGLFIPQNVTLSSGNFVNIPDQEINRNGKIKVPYAGSIDVLGRSPSEIEDEIESRLSQRAIEPQAVVSISGRASNLVTVLGDVVEAGRFNINLKDYRMLDALGSAKGSRFQDFETLVTLQRRGRKATVRMSALTHYPKNNIQVQLGDTVYVQRSQRHFALLGAVNKPGEFVFDRAHMTAANALSLGGGLVDERADPYTIVVYRLEERAMLEKYGATIPEKYGKRVPTVYRINIRDTDGFFFAKHFRIRNHDLLYAANSRWIDALKINAIIRDYANTVMSGRGAVESFGTGLPARAIVGQATP